MSLRPDDRSSRNRSRSRSRTREKDRSRSRSNVREPEDSKEPSPPSSYGYTRDSYRNGATSAQYEANTPAPTGVENSKRQPSYPPQSSVPYPQDDDEYAMGGYSGPSYAPAVQFPAMLGDDDLAYGDVPPSNNSRQVSYSNPYPPNPAGSVTTPGYGYTPEPVLSARGLSSYNNQYAEPSRENDYTAKQQSGSRNDQYAQNGQSRYPEQSTRNYASNSYECNGNVQTKPGQESSNGKKGVRLSVDTRDSSGMTGRMDRLSVNGNRPDARSGELPPPSPLLEAYRGTYQQISPMPLAARPNDDDDLSDIPSLDSGNTSRGVGFKEDDKLSRDAAQTKTKRNIKIYDPEADAKTISKALSATKVDQGAICDVLPGLSHDQVWYMRKEYKKLVKVQGRGVKLPNHLKSKLTGNFGKAAYVTALGRFESEGYWANFWYQSHSSRRELLIESLMGRTNAEIWNIKDEFRDKRYSDDLIQCMEKELKMDKFRTAVLMVLEERRQEEQDVYPFEYKTRDVETLHKALKARQGGESTMLEIIVRRSDSHLREVLKMYEKAYQENFPRAALQKSNNLVGEVIAHILNGVINRPARDALLLRHAISDIAERNQDEELRYELLISRLIRLHWDKPHLAKVKKDYYTKYRKTLEDDIDDATGGSYFTEFMVELCSTQTKA